MKFVVFCRACGPAFKIQKGGRKVEGEIV